MAIKCLNIFSYTGILTYSDSWLQLTTEWCAIMVALIAYSETPFYDCNLPSTTELPSTCCSWTPLKLAEYSIWIPRRKHFYNWLLYLPLSWWRSLTPNVFHCHYYRIIGTFWMKSCMCAWCLKHKPLLIWRHVHFNAISIFCIVFVWKANYLP